MNDTENDYSDYLDARDLEGGPHPGRARLPRGILVSAVVAVGLLVLGLLLLV